MPETPRANASTRFHATSESIGGGSKMTVTIAVVMVTKTIAAQATKPAHQLAAPPTQPRREVDLDSPRPMTLSTTV
jgi:hypothetical protein